MFGQVEREPVEACEPVLALEAEVRLFSLKQVFQYVRLHLLGRRERQQTHRAYGFAVADLNQMIQEGLHLGEHGAASLASELPGAIEQAMGNELLLGNEKEVALAAE